MVGVLDPVNGSVAIVGDKAVFTPRADYFGNGGFSYRISDGNGGFAVGAVTLFVLPDQELPVAVNDHGWTIDEDSFVDIDPATLIANDYDPDGDTIQFVGAEGQGVTTLPNGLIRFAPPLNANGSFTSTYAISDGHGPTAIGSFTVFVRAVDDDPLASNDTLAGVEDQTLTVPILQLTGNDRNPDGQDITLTAVSNAVGGIVSFDGVGNVVFIPDADRNGPASFDYTITDGSGAVDTATATINLQPINDAPQIDNFGPLPGAEDSWLAAQLPGGAFHDIDGDSLVLTVRAAGGGALPTWLSYDAASRGLFGQPPANFAGSIGFEVVASDGAATTVKSFDLVIQGVNDAPVAHDNSWTATSNPTVIIPIAELLRNDGDIDGDALSILSVSGNSGLQVALDGNGNVVVTRQSAEEGDLSFTYVAGDAGGLTDAATVWVNAPTRNVAPFIDVIATQHGTEDEAVGFTLPAGIVSDANGDDLTITAARRGGSALPNWLTFDAATLTFAGTPPADFAAPSR